MGGHYCHLTIKDQNLTVLLFYSGGLFLLFALGQVLLFAVRQVSLVYHKWHNINNKDTIVHRNRIFKQCFEISHEIVNIEKFKIPTYIFSRNSGFRNLKKDQPEASFL